MHRSVLLSVALLAVAACSEKSMGPAGTNSRLNQPSFSTGSPAAFTATFGDAVCQNGPGVVNCNIYLLKEDVALNAGPDGATLDDGTYFFAVVAPSGQNAPNDGTPGLLSTDAYTDRDFTVSGGIVSYSGPHAIDSDGDIQLIPYLDTPNPGGVYILAICNITAGYPATPANCKYDAFKVREGGTTEQGNPELSGLKYYDANLNGQFDAGEDGIPGWLITVTGYAGSPVTTGLDGTFDITVDIGQHVLTEQQPGNGWSQTGNTVDQFFDFLHSTTLTSFVYTVDAVGDGVTTGLNFGNVCNLVTPGGRTLGFWSNRNGAALFTSADLAALNAFYLANGTGNQSNFANYAAFRTWLLSATATNMAYMLSAQMAATYLSVQHGFTNGAAIVDYFDSDYDGSYPAPRTVNQEIQYANYLLSLDQTTIVSDALRTEQERVKNILDSVNNGGTFLAPTLADALEACGTPFSF
jgi:hypothetical protein